jgi:hypothetical protein
MADRHATVICGNVNGGIVVNLSAAVTTSGVAVEVAKVGKVEHGCRPGFRPRERSAT